MMKKILILGAKGTLGQALVEIFGAHGCDIVAWDKEQCDVSEMRNKKSEIRSLNVDVIANAVALNAVDHIEIDDEMFEIARVVNGTAVGELAEIAKDLGVAFVHYSTDYVFDGKTTEPYTEDAIPNPISRYGETKLLGERCVQEKGLNFYIIRLSRVFGKARNGVTAKQSFVDKMIALAQSKDHLDIVNDQTSTPSYAPDVAEFTYRLLEQEKPFGIYHGSNSGSCTWYEWAKKIFEIKNITIDIAPVLHSQFPRPAKVPTYSVLKNTKMKEQRSWEDALEEYLQ